MEGERKEEVKGSEDAYIVERLMNPQECHAFESGFPLNYQATKIPCGHTAIVILEVCLEP